MREIESGNPKEAKTTSELLKDFAKTVQQLPNKPEEVDSEEAYESITDRLELSWEDENRTLILVPDRELITKGVTGRARFDVSEDSLTVSAVSLFSPSEFGRFTYMFKNDGNIIENPKSSFEKNVRESDIDLGNKRSIAFHLDVLNRDIAKYLSQKESK